MSRSSSIFRIAGAAVASILALTACTIVTTPGPTRTEARTVSHFTKVELSGSGQVIIEQTGSESLTVEAGENVLPNLTSEVVAGTLVLGTKHATALPPDTPIVYHLTVKSLTALAVSGSGQVTAPGITTDSLSSDISGSGTITVGGSAPEQRLTISGSGNYEGGDLAGKAVLAEISGSGSAVVNVSDTLKVTISGSGTLTYSGNPTVQTDISGSGSVTKA